MLEKDQEPQTLLPGTIRLIAGNGKEIQQKNAIRQLLSGRYFEQKQPKPVSQREVYQHLAMVLPAKIEPTFILSEIAKMKDEILDEAQEKAFLQNARIFLQELLIADSFDEKFTGLKDFLRDNPSFNAEKMQASQDPLVKAFYDMIKSEKPEALRHELYEEARLAAISGTVLKKDLSTNKEVRIDKKAERRQQMKEEMQEAGDIDISHYLNETLMKKGSESTISEIAHQVATDLMNTNRALLMQISPDEMAYLDKKEQSPHFAQMTDFYVSIGSRLMFDVLNAENAEHQQRIYDFYLKVLDESTKMGDFQTAMAIFSALNHSSVSNLSYLHDSNGILLQCGETFLPKGGFKLLRKMIREKENDFIPFTAFYAKDLVANREATIEVTQENLGEREQAEVLNLQKYETASLIYADLAKRQAESDQQLLNTVKPITNIRARTQGFHFSEDVAYKRVEEIFPEEDRRSKGKKRPFRGSSHQQRDSMRLMEETHMRQRESLQEEQEVQEIFKASAPFTEGVKAKPEEEKQVAKVEEKDPILEEAIRTIRTMARGEGDSPATVKLAGKILLKLNAIRDDNTLSQQDKAKKTQTYLTEILTSPHTSDFIKNKVSFILTDYLKKEMPPPAERPPLPPSAIELKFQALDEEMAKLKQTIAIASQELAIQEARRQEISLSQEDAESILEIEPISKEAISQAAAPLAEKKAASEKANLAQAIEADANLVSSTEVARRVALNSPVWLIDADKPKRGQEPTQMNVVRVLGNVALSREPMTMQTGFAYAYPVTTKVHGLTRFNREPMFFAVMGPDQFLSKEGVTLKEETIGKLINHFQSRLQEKDIQSIQSELKALKVNELFPSWKPEGSRSIGFEQVEAILKKYHVTPSSDDIVTIGRFLQADLGGRHVAQVAEEIGIGDPKKYAALTIAGNKRSEASGFGIESGQVPEGMSSRHITKLKDGSEVPTASVYVNHHPNVSQHLVLQSGGEIEGKATTLTFHGLDLNHIVEFYLRNKEQGIPVVVNCTDGIDRTGMLVTALAMLNDYNQNKSQDITLESAEVQQKILIELIENLRKDRGPFFLRGNEDIAIAVTLGFALIATQKQLDFQKNLKSEKDLNPQLREILEKANTLEPRELQLTLDESLDKLPAKEATIAESWAKLVRARVNADKEYVKANVAGSYKSSFEKDFPRTNNMSDGAWAKERKALSFDDFSALKDKGFEIEPHVGTALSNFIKAPTLSTLQSLSVFMESEVKNKRSLEKSAKDLGYDVRLFEALAKVKNNQRVGDMFSNITLSEKQKLKEQLKGLMVASKEKKFQSLCERVINALPSDTLIRKQEAKLSTQPSHLTAKTSTSQSVIGTFFNILGSKQEQNKEKTKEPANKASKEPHTKEGMPSITSGSSPVSRHKTVRFMGVQESPQSKSERVEDRGEKTQKIPKKR